LSPPFCDAIKQCNKAIILSQAFGSKSLFIKIWFECINVLVKKN